jgi:MerR family transcriptional regulator, light-induced transcriptional regulator
MQRVLRVLRAGCQTSTFLSMSVIRTNAAAAMLGVSPNTLRSWERRFGYPTPQRTEGGHRQFDLAEIEALRQAFDETHNISSAVSVARERGRGLASPGRLRAALATFDNAKADRLLEESLAVRSVERTVESLLLPAVEALDDDIGGPSPEYGFAWRYATGWLAAAQRVAPAATRDASVLIFDASRPTDADALHIQALELFVRRAGLRALSLPVELEPARVARALRALTPDAVVLSGTRASLDALGRLVYAARQSGDNIVIFDFRGALPDTGASTVERLGPGPIAAADVLRERLIGARVAPLRRVAASRGA